MGAAVSLGTGQLDLRKRSLNYETLRQHMDLVGEYALSRCKSLFLCRNKLSAMPPEVNLMKSLVIIYCTDNWLKWLPDYLKYLPYLAELKVGGNQLVSIDNLRPDENPSDEQLDIDRRFHTLRIGHNRITAFPAQMNRFYLKTIIANNNNLTSLPLDFFELGTLEVLVLSKNRIVQLPTVENRTLRLKILILSGNLLKSVPHHCINKMYQLRKLLLNNNKLEMIPRGINSLKDLVHLELHQNQLDTEAVIRSGIMRVTQFEELKLKPGNLKLNMGLIRQSSSRSGSTLMSRGHPTLDEQIAAGQNRPQTGQGSPLGWGGGEESHEGSPPTSPDGGHTQSKEGSSPKTQPSPVRALLQERGNSDLPLAPSLRKRILAERAANPEKADEGRVVAISPTGRGMRGSPTAGSPVGALRKVSPKGGRSPLGGARSPLGGANSPGPRIQGGAVSPGMRSPIGKKSAPKANLEDELRDPSPERVPL